MSVGDIVSTDVEGDTSLLLLLLLRQFVKITTCAVFTHTLVYLNISFF